MSNNSFKIKNSVHLVPQDLTAIVGPQDGDMACDILDNKVKFYDSGSTSWKEVADEAIITDHIADSSGAHAGSAISNTPSGNLAATDVQGALNELQTDVDTRATGAASSTDNALARFDLTTGKVLQNSVGILSDAGILTGLTGLTSSGTIESTGTLLLSGTSREGVAADNVTTGSNAAVTAFSPIVRLTNSSLVSIDSISSPTSGQSVTLLNQTGNSITINNNLGNIKTGTGSPVTVKDEASILLKYDPTEARWMIIGGTGSGSGAGGINYFSANSDFEAGITGYATYDDGAVAVPVDGTGGSPSVITFAASASSPLRGLQSGVISRSAASGLGEGLSYAFTIDSADQAQVLRFSFDYATSANYADGDIRLYIYDVTNAVLIDVIDRDLSASSYGKYIGSFQTSSNSTSYRAIWHCAVSTATAWTVKIDNVVVGPQTLIKGPMVTDWVSFTPTGGFSGANVTWVGRYRRVGDSAQFEVSLDFTGAPTGTIMDMTLPNGLTIDTSKLTSSTSNDQMVGVSHLIDSDVSANRQNGTVVLGSTSSLVRVRWEQGLVSNTSPFTWATGDQAWLNFTVPILGWSSNTVLSEDAGNREIHAHVGLSGTQSVVSAAVTTIAFDTVIRDTTSSFNTSTNTWTAPESGLYDMFLSVYATSLAAELFTVALVASGTGAGGTMSATPSGTTQQFTISKTAYLAKGATVYATIQSTADIAYSVVSTANRTCLTIAKRAAPQTIGMSDVVSARYTSDSGQAIIATAATMLMEDRQFDTHNAYNTSTGEYTVPVSGKYSMTFRFRTDSFTPSTDVNAISSSFYVNGVQTILATPRTGSVTNSTYTSMVSTSAYQLSKGDIVTVRAACTTTTTMAVSGTLNEFSIVKVG